MMPTDVHCMLMDTTACLHLDQQPACALVLQLNLKRHPEGCALMFAQCKLVHWCFTSWQLKIVTLHEQMLCCRHHMSLFGVQLL